MTDFPLSIDPDNSIAPDRSYTATIELRTSTSALMFLPAIVTVNVSGVIFKSVLHRRRKQHNISFAISGNELLSGIKITASSRVKSVRLLRLDERLELGKILIISPHPDDAELAAGGLYMSHCEQVFIATMSAGERIKRLGSQYIKRLDGSLIDATASKAVIRSWNSVHTPSIVGVPVDRCVNLGLPDSYLMHIAINASPQLKSPEKVRRRAFNFFALPCDRDGLCTHSSTILDLCHLIEVWKPETLVVMDPEIDVHKDHRACSLLLADALEACRHRPAFVMLCSVHHRNRLISHPGRAFDAAYTASDSDRNQKIFSDVENYVHILSDEAIRRKALLFESMCELSHHRMRIVNVLLRLLYFDFASLTKMVAGERHLYFNRFLRRTEFYRKVTVDHFVSCVRAARSEFR